MATITATLAPAMGNSQRGRNPYMVEQVVDHKAELRWLKTPFLFVHIAAVLDGREDGSVGAGAANAPLLQHPDQSGLGETGWWLGKFLLLEKVDELK